MGLEIGLCVRHLFRRHIEQGSGSFEAGRRKQAIACGVEERRVVRKDLGDRRGTIVVKVTAGVVANPPEGRRPHQADAASGVEETHENRVQAKAARGHCTTEVVGGDDARRGAGAIDRLLNVEDERGQPTGVLLGRRVIGEPGNNLARYCVDARSEVEHAGHVQHWPRVAVRAATHRSFDEHDAATLLGGRIARRERRRSGRVLCVVTQRLAREERALERGDVRSFRGRELPAGGRRLVVGRHRVGCLTFQIGFASVQHERWFEKRRVTDGRRSATHPDLAAPIRLEPGVGLCRRAAACDADVGRQRKVHVEGSGIPQQVVGIATYDVRVDAAKERVVGQVAQCPTHLNGLRADAEILCQHVARIAGAVVGTEIGVEEQQGAMRRTGAASRARHRTSREILEFVGVRRDVAHGGRKDVPESAFQPCVVENALFQREGSTSLVDGFTRDVRGDQVGRVRLGVIPVSTHFFAKEVPVHVALACATDQVDGRSRVAIAEIIPQAREVFDCGRGRLHNRFTHGDGRGQRPFFLTWRRSVRRRFGRCGRVLGAAAHNEQASQQDHQSIHTGHSLGVGLAGHSDPRLPICLFWPKVAKRSGLTLAYLI